MNRNRLKIAVNLIIVVILGQKMKEIDRILDLILGVVDLELVCVIMVWVQILVQVIQMI